MATALSAELRRLRLAKGASQNEVAKAVGVQRPTISQWEGDLNRPSAERLQRLDDYFGTRGELIKLAGRSRTASRSEPVEAPRVVPPVGAPTRSLKSVLADTRRAFLDQLYFDGSGRAIGWRHNLVPSDEPPSVLSTAYGLKVLAMLGGPDANTGSVVDWVLGRAVRADGELIGW